MTGPFKMRGWSGYQSSPAKTHTKDADGNPIEHKKNISTKGNIMTNTETGDTYNLETGETIKNKKPAPGKQTKETLNVKPGSVADEKTKIAEANAEDAGQQIIGKVKRGEISQEEGNKQLAALQDAQ